MKPLIIGITGGTGSGKTTVARRIYESLKGVNVVVIQQDAYYKDLNHLPLEERKKINVEPSKRYADIVIPQGGLNDVAIDIIVSKIKSRT